VRPPHVKDERSPLRDAGHCDTADLEDADGDGEQHTWRKWRKEEGAN